MFCFVCNLNNVMLCDVMHCIVMYCSVLECDVMNVIVCDNFCPDMCKKKYLVYIFIYRHINSSEFYRQRHKQPKKPTFSLPICSIYGIFTYMSLIFMVNVGKYSIHVALSLIFCLDMQNPSNMFVSGRWSRCSLM